MGYSKKTAKGRLDKYYHLAKEQGYRARSAFKLVQLNKKYEFLQNSRVVIDLCAAPGGWCQVAAKFMPKSKIIIGVDLAPIKPITGVITMINDITTEKCRTDIKRELKDWKADVVLHDGAPNVGNSWVQDAYTQSELVLSSLKLATEFLIEGGWFITKVFRSKDYNSLMWVFNQLFKKVEATKPSSSRDVSAEIFVVCKGYLAPKTIDPRFLDPRSVFTDVDNLINGGSSTAKTNLLHPDKKRRHRDGYEDGANILFKKLDAIEYITSEKFSDLLAESNCITFDPSHDLTKTILSDLETSEEMKNCCEDLKVLGRREFKLLLRWRLRMRKVLGFDAEEKPVAAEEAATEANSEDDIEALNESLKKKAKREKRKALERKAKLRIRLNMQMENANDLADGIADDSLFSLKKVKSSAPVQSYEEPELTESSDESEGEKHYESSDESDEEGRYNRMERELEAIHSEVRSKADIKKANKKNKQEESDDSNDELEQEDGLEDLPEKPLLVDMRKPDEIKAINTAKVSMWYSNPLFKSMSQISADIMKHQEEKKTKKKNRQYQENPVDFIKAEAEAESGKVINHATSKKVTDNSKKTSKSKEDEPTAGSITFVKVEDKFDHCFDEEDAKMALSSEEGMAMATKLASGNRNKMREELIDESFNRFAFAEKSTDLPAWFHEDESKHNKPIKPITREVADAIKNKFKEINDLPIKKILEAKGRNKTRSLRRLEGLKKKAEAIMGSGEEGEKAKLIQISKMLKKTSVKREKPALVVAKGLNRGLKGRPKGVKGRYKMVDSRMMKELRAEKRAKKKASKK
jgi:AdoMet-dependent rRNA methyltransferase SPB1